MKHIVKICFCKGYFGAPHTIQSLICHFSKHINFMLERFKCNWCLICKHTDNDFSKHRLPIGTYCFEKLSKFLLRRFSF